MNKNSLSGRFWRPLRGRLPAAALMILLQRTCLLPVARVVETAAAASPWSAVLRSALGAAALVAVDTLAGATALVPTQNSPVQVSLGTPMTGIGFTVSNTINIASWKIGGSIPPGLAFTAVQGGVSLSGPGTLDATSPGMPSGGGYGGGGTVGGNATTTPLLSGTPTQAGSYTFTLQAFEFPALAGLASDTFSFTINVVNPSTSNTPPTITTQPQSQNGNLGAMLMLTTLAAPMGGNPAPTYQWTHDGDTLPGVMGAMLTLPSLQPQDAGVYAAEAMSGGAAWTDPAIVGLLTSNESEGAATVVGTDILHPNGNHFDQVLLTGKAESITAPAGRVTRTSFIDMNDDIVQVEFSGAGTVSLVLDGQSGPAAPVSYNQPTVQYVKGHVGIVVVGADETSNLSVFTVGRATAFDPTGGFNILQPIGAGNDPAHNGSSLFQGHEATHYDGVADIAFVAISSRDGKFGGLRTANANYWATKGITGVYAPGVTFVGPIFVGNVDAMLSATPYLLVGSAQGEVHITGGNLKQDNGGPILTDGITALKFTPGITSAGTPLPAQMNQGHLFHGAVDVTGTIVVNP